MNGHYEYISTEIVGFYKTIDNNIVDMSIDIYDEWVDYFLFENEDNEKIKEIYFKFPFDVFYEFKYNPLIFPSLKKISVDRNNEMCRDSSYTENSLELNMGNYNNEIEIEILDESNVCVIYVI